MDQDGRQVGVISKVPVDENGKRARFVFITTEAGVTVFAHAAAFDNAMEFRRVRLGTRVSFEVHPDPKGPVAKHVRRVKVTPSGGAIRGASGD